MPGIGILPDDCSDRNCLKRAIIYALTGDLSIHHRLKQGLEQAGFKVRRIRKYDFHDVWELRVQRGPEMFQDSYVQIRRRIRRVLKAEQLYTKSQGPEVGFQGRNLVVGFCSKLGGVGEIK